MRGIDSILNDKSAWPDARRRPQGLFQNPTTLSESKFLLLFAQKKDEVTTQYFPQLRRWRQSSRPRASAKRRGGN